MNQSSGLSMLHVVVDLVVGGWSGLCVVMLVVGIVEVVVALRCSRLREPVSRLVSEPADVRKVFWEIEVADKDLFVHANGPAVSVHVEELVNANWYPVWSSTNMPPAPP